MNKHMIAIVATAVALTGCATPQTQAPVATEDLNVGIASTCTPSAIDLSTAPTAAATITMTNDGWCAVHTKESSGKPFLLGLVKTNPAHGRILIQKVGGETRIEYTANERYVGADKFTVALRPTTASAADNTVQVAVNVTMGPNMPPEEAPKPAAPAPRSSRPARSSRTTS